MVCKFAVLMRKMFIDKQWFRCKYGRCKQIFGMEKIQGEAKQIVRDSPRYTMTFQSQRNYLQLLYFGILDRSEL